MNCTIEGCIGEYENKRVLQADRGDGGIVLVSNVPAQVCNFCGDVLLTWDTMAQVEAFLETHPQPLGTAPVYEFATQWMAKQLAEPVGTGAISSNGHKPGR